MTMPFTKLVGGFLLLASGALALFLWQQPTSLNTQAKPVDTAAGRAYLPIVESGPGRFLATFDGEPARPTPWQPADWDVTVHSRSREHLYELAPMQAGHGANCEAPPATHRVTTYEDAVYTCRNHVMTAINEGGYGLIYLTPNHMVDFSRGEAVVRFDVSTLRTSSRDWIDLWITPYEDQLQLPLEEWLPDLSGEPRRAVFITMGSFNSDTIFQGNVVRDFDVQSVDGNTWTGYEEFLTPSAMERTTFELRISETHLKFGMPDYDFWWIDTPIAPLGWRQGIVQLGHHSYNPQKDCSNCQPNTWHWDNVFIEPAVPFTLIRATQRYVDASTGPAVTFARPAPQDAHLRFAGIGNDLEVSFDDGATWQKAEVQPQLRTDEGTFWSYWMPIPAGVSRVYFRGEDWWGGKWHVRDLSIWSLSNG